MFAKTKLNAVLFYNVGARIDSLFYRLIGKMVSNYQGHKVKSFGGWQDVSCHFSFAAEISIFDLQSKAKD